MTLDMDDDTITTCTCGKAAVKVNIMDTGKLAHCGARSCRNKASRQIEDMARSHPAHLAMFDGVVPLIDKVMGEGDPPTDRVLAVVYGLMDAAAPLIAALMKAELNDELGAVVTEWVRKSVSNLGYELAALAGPAAALAADTEPS